MGSVSWQQWTVRWRRASSGSGRRSAVTSSTAVTWGRRCACTGTAARWSTCGAAWPTAGPAAAWARDTLQLVYSATKAATATCAHLLAQRGELDLDRPVAVVLAGVRGRGQGGHPGPLAAVPPGRAAGHRPPHPAGRPAGLGSDGGRAGRPAAGVGARHRPRIPRPDVRLARRRGHQAGQRPQRGDGSSPRRSPGRPGSTSSSACRRTNGAGSARWSSTTRRDPRPSPASRSSRCPSSSARCWRRSPIPVR